MQINYQASSILLVGFMFLLATSVSCNRVERTVEAENGAKAPVEQDLGETKTDKSADNPGSQAEDQDGSDQKAAGQPESKPTDDEPKVADQVAQPSYQLPAQEKKPEVQTIEIPSTWKRLSKQHEIWIDKEAKEVIIAGEVCLNQGPLEMFICPEATKEHESVISANALSSELHGALIFLGADPGKAASWNPEYRPAYGPKIEITLKWRDEETKKVVSESARQWIRNVNTKKPLAVDWVFGGSQFWEDPDTKEQVYYGDSGEMVCLSNFSTATIDLNVESSNANAGLLFEAFTENIPPLGTKVYAIIKPGERIEPAKQPESEEGKAETDEGKGESEEGKGETDEGKGESEEGKESRTNEKRFDSRMLPNLNEPFGGLTVQFLN